MAEIQASAIRRGTTILYEGAPYRVLEFAHRTPGNLRAFVQTKLRNLLTGTQREVRFSATAMVERVSVQIREMDFLYREGETGVFMDAETYEQISIGDDLYQEAAPWLSEGLRVQVEMLGAQPIGIELPKTIEISVRETEPVIKGQTAAKSNKPATLENGVTIQVPPFIAAGERIRVDPGELRYIERAK